MKIEIYNNNVSLILESFESGIYTGDKGSTLTFQTNNRATYSNRDESYSIETQTEIPTTYIYKRGKPYIMWGSGDRSMSLKMQKETIYDDISGETYTRKAYGYILNKIAKHFTFNQYIFDLRSAGVLKKGQTLKDIANDSAKLLKGVQAIRTNSKVQNYLYYWYHKSLGMSDDDAMHNPEGYGYCRKERRKKYSHYFNRYAMGEDTTKLFKRNSKSETIQFNIGFLRTIIQYIYKHYPLDMVDIQDFRINKTYVKPDREYTFGDKTLWDYQKDAVDFILDTLEDTDSLGDLFSAINSIFATNSGKTLMLLAIAYNLYDSKIIIPCHTDLLFSKTVADYTKLGIQVSCICSDNSRRQAIKLLKNEKIEERPLWNTLGDFCVVMLPTFVPRLLKGEYTSDQLHKYNIGIFDECEDIIQKSAKNFDIFINALQLYYRIASSGTSKVIKRIDKRAEIIGHFGKARHTITTEQNIARGASLEGRFTMELFSPSVGLSTDDVLMHPDRLKIAIEWLKKHNPDYTLFYVGRNKAAIIEDIANALKEAFPDKSVDTLTGYTKERSDVLHKINTGEINIVVTSSVVSRGLNFSILDSVINYNPVAGSENTLQAIYGRPMRVHEGMDYYVGLDIFDKTTKHEKYSYERYSLHKDKTHGGILTCSSELTDYLKIYE